MGKTSSGQLLALTQGDPAGVGPDIAIAAWLKRDASNLAPFIYVGDPRVLADRAQHLGLAANIAECEFDRAVSTFSEALPVFAIDAGADVTPGKPDSKTANATIEAIRIAVSAVQAGRASAVVTCPIAKSVLYDAGFAFPGHTEFLAALANPNGQPPRPVMMIAGPQLRTVPVTIHIPLSHVPDALTQALIEETCRIVHHDMKRRFGLARPRLALSGLNPHAGEDGALGKEDDLVIRPAIEALRAEGINAFGPLPADTMFHERARADYDVAICMYHDQALIPAKTLSFDDGVNVTLGLPFIRTSPDHGTAFGIAGSGKARPDSLIAALKMAEQMASYSEQS